MVLKKENVERITDNALHIEKLKADGYKEIEQVKQLAEGYANMKSTELKALCDKRGIEYDGRAKKDDLVAVLDAYDKEQRITEGAE